MDSKVQIIIDGENKQIEFVGIKELVSKLAEEWGIGDLYTDGMKYRMAWHKTDTKDGIILNHVEKIVDRHNLNTREIKGNIEIVDKNKLDIQLRGESL